MKRFLIFSFCLMFLHMGLSAQSTRVFGLRDNTPQVFAFTNATLVTEPGRTLEGATLVVRDGAIEAAGTRVAIPPDAYIIDLEGKYIYPGFIDMYSGYGIPPAGEDEAVTGAHWNPQVRSFVSSATVFNPVEAEASEWRAQGFVMAHVVPGQGVFAGQGAIVLLGEGNTGAHLLKPAVSQVMKTSPSDRRQRGYPTSAMGAFSLIRQTLYDAQWYADAHRKHLANPLTSLRPENNPALEALGASMQSGTTFVFECPDEQWLIRAADLAAEFPVKLLAVGSGYEYRRADAVAATKLPVILPLAFPKAPEVGSPEQAMQASLEELRHWYLAPENPAIMAEKGVPFCFTARGNKSDFIKNLQTAVKRGLSEKDALAALTTTPAQLLGIQNRYGTLHQGKAANFIIADNNIFAHGGEVEEVWIDGRSHPVKPAKNEPAGNWDLEAEGLPGEWMLGMEGSAPRYRGTISRGDKKLRLTSVKADRQRVSFAFAGDSVGMPGIYRMSANIGQDGLLGLGEAPDGSVFTWKARREEPRQEGSPEENKKDPVVLDLPARFPSLDYGLTSIPEQPEHILVKNATIWTQGPAGKIEGGDMLISRGKIVAVGQALQAPRGATVIDATGLHVTPGLIDPHLHTSIIGQVNETGDAITSETRIADVIDANNVWIYRLLAGGLTTAKLFHGSANPVGGQDAVIKMRWGSLPDELLMQEAKPGLKFALGENVKRSPGRYPNTRMGTEQIIRDAFEAALEYERQWERQGQGGSGLPVRRDLQLEPILEVIKGERLAHVHAYRQDEMLMTMRLAEEYGFTIASFEHTLEGYKIADELRDHGAAAVVWTDWSSFKVEAYDGILQNARLLVDAGVLTSLHSDNTQLSTRMNWEAAKTMKTGVAEEEALNLITMNPARILRVDHVIGSLEAGKDADFVIWSGHPMSTFSTARQTWIEGRKYFDRALDEVLRVDIRRERAMIIQAILQQESATPTDTARERQ
ncbi:MAG: amidohydrolase family protein [Bacteroidales bacterium]